MVDENHLLEVLEFTFRQFRIGMKSKIGLPVCLGSCTGIFSSLQGKVKQGRTCSHIELLFVEISGNTARPIHTFLFYSILFCSILLCSFCCSLLCSALFCLCGRKSRYMICKLKWAVPCRVSNVEFVWRRWLRCNTNVHTTEPCNVKPCHRVIYFIYSFPFVWPGIIIILRKRRIHWYWDRVQRIWERGRKREGEIVVKRGGNKRTKRIINMILLFIDIFMSETSMLSILSVFLSVPRDWRKRCRMSPNQNDRLHLWSCYLM